MTILRGGLAAAVALAAALAVGLAPSEARAGPASRKRLEPPAGSPMPGATGKVKAREKKRDRTVAVKVRDLLPDKVYEVRGATDDRPMGTLETNRRGRGKATIREAKDGVSGPSLRDDGGEYSNGWIEGSDGGWYDGSGGTPGEGSDDRGSPWDGEPGDDCGCDWYCVQIVDPDTGECLLICEDADDDLQDGGTATDALYGFGAYGLDQGGPLTFVTLFRFGTDDGPVESFDLSLEEYTGDARSGTIEFHTFHADQETGLPVGADSVTDLAGRAFEIRDAAGAFVVGGDLPELESLGDLPIFDPADGEPGGGGMPDPVDGEPVYFLWIADGSGVLQEVAPLVHYIFEFEIPDDSWEGVPGDCSGNGGDDDPGERDASGGNLLLR